MRWLIAVCVVIWQDAFPIQAPGRTMEQEVRVTVCEGTPPTVSIETRLVSDGRELAEWQESSVWPKNSAPIPLQ